MTRRLTLQEVTETGHVDLGTLEAADTVIGREPSEEPGITLPSTAVSRNHGRFSRIRNHWFYRDLGSTNGSWVNGHKVSEGQWRIVRSGDVIQLGDKALRLVGLDSGTQRRTSVTGLPALGGRSLIVFNKGEFLDEFPVPEYGRALVIGGGQADLEIEGVAEDLPALVMERKGMEVTAFRVSKTLLVSRDGEEISENVVLKDGDELAVASYRVVYNDPNAGLSASGSGPAQGPDSGTMSLALQGREWKQNEGGDSGPGMGPTLTKTMKKIPFGQRTADLEEDLVDQTVALDPEDVKARLSGYDMHPSMRHNVDEEPKEYSLGGLEDKLVVFIGFALLLALLVLLIWWVLT